MHAFVAFLEKHMILTAGWVISMWLLFVYVVLKVFTNPPDIPSGTVTAFLGFFGLAALAVGLWQFRIQTMDSRKGIKHDPSISESMNKFVKWDGDISDNSEPIYRGRDRW